jgi:hypothetical protein
MTWDAQKQQFYDEAGFHAQETWSVVVSLLSTVSSLCVLGTGFMFYKEMVRSKVYMKLILMMSFCDMLGSMSMLFGYPRDAFGCSVQGFVYMFFYRASWMWCLMMTITLYQHLRFGVIRLDFSFMNYLVWFSNVVLQVLPVAYHDGYGLPANFLGFGVCSLGRKISGSDTSNGKWMNGVFFGPLCLLLTLMVGLDFHLYFNTLPSLVGSNSEAAAKLKKLVQNIALYPVGMFFMWMPTFLVLVSVEINPKVAHGASGKVLETANLALTTLAAGFGCVRVF